MIKSTLRAMYLLVGATICLGQPEQLLLLQKPTLSRDHIAFIYAGDLWIAARQGGEAKRLTTGLGIETTPYFSPEGTVIAFTAEYDGNIDVYTIPASGGVPSRLTYHPGPDLVGGWTVDGKQVLFRSSRHSYSYFNRLFTIPVGGGFPAEIPLPIAQEGAYSPDGTRLAYVPTPQWQPAWKRYRGGQTKPIWSANLIDSGVIEKIPRDNSNDFNPVWAGQTIYFLSDRDGPVTLFAYDLNTKQVTKVVQNDGLDFKSACAGPGAIVYEQFGSVHLFDLAAGQSKLVDIRVVGDFPEVRPHFQKVMAKNLSNAGLSPTGVRAVFQARGEVVSVPAEKGDLCWYLEVDQVKPVRIDTDLFESPFRAMDPVWSPDSRWLAYAKYLPNHLHTIFVYSIADKKSRQITDGMSDALYPVFDKSGKHLYFTASTDLGLSAGREGALFLQEGSPVLWSPKDEPSALTLHKFDLSERKTDKVLEGVNAFTLSADGEKMLYLQDEKWFIASTAEEPKPGEGELMLGELSLGHVFVWGGETPEVKKVPVGLLGADYEIGNGRYRFARVYSGENWNPELRAPLTQPGANVAAGEYLPLL